MIFLDVVAGSQSDDLCFVKLSVGVIFNILDARTTDGVIGFFDQPGHSIILTYRPFGVNK